MFRDFTLKGKLANAYNMPLWKIYMSAAVCTNDTDDDEIEVLFDDTCSVASKPGEEAFPRARSNSRQGCQMFFLRLRRRFSEISAPN